MKKKMFALIAVLVLLTVAVAGTVAYFTASKQTHNVITSGYVDIELVEGEAGVTYNNSVHNLMPGVSQSKIVRIHNVGDETAWVRAKVDVSIETPEGKALPADVLEINFDDTKWEKKDGYYYYKEYLTKDGKTETPLFTQVKLKGAETGNEYQGAKIEVNVKAEAIQWKHNKLEAGADITSVWPDVQILPYPLNEE